MALVRSYGRMWARNDKNIGLVERQKGMGVYILYDGSLPVYVGMGDIAFRLRKAKKSKRRGEMWDHFSWYIPCSPELTRDIEALLLKMLPAPLCILNRQKGKLAGAVRIRELDPRPDVITRKMKHKAALKSG